MRCRSGMGRVENSVLLVRAGREGIRSVLWQVWPAISFEITFHRVLSVAMIKLLRSLEIGLRT
jgi:hypothetical protein